MKNTNGNPYFMELRASSVGKMGLTLGCWQLLKAAETVTYGLNWDSGIRGRHGQEIKLFHNLFFLENLMKFYNANYMKTAWWFGQCSDHSRHIQMILIFGKTVKRVVSVLKKKTVNMKQKANEEKKILLWLITRYKIAQLLQNLVLKALMQLKISYIQYYSLNPLLTETCTSKDRTRENAIQKLRLLKSKEINTMSACPQ